MVEHRKTKYIWPMFQIFCMDDSCDATQGQFESMENCFKAWNRRKDSR